MIVFTVLFILIVCISIMAVIINFPAIIDFFNKPAEVNPYGKYRLYRKTIDGKEFYYAKVKVSRVFPIYRVFRHSDIALHRTLKDEKGYQFAERISEQYLWDKKQHLIGQLEHKFQEETQRKKVKKEFKSKGKRINN